MPIAHVFLALLVVVVWGVNFLFVKLGLDEVSPFLLCAARFFFASVPAIFFVKWPKEPFRLVAGYGLIMFALQFGFVFMGMRVGMTPGMASLIMQVQVFFSMFFAMILLNEKPSLAQIFGAIVAFSGIGLVSLNFDASVSFLGFVLVLAAAATWGIGNLVAKKIQPRHLFAVIVWGSFIACFPMTILSIVFEGKAGLIASYERLTFQGIGALFYIVYVSTWVGYGVWNWLLSRYPVGMVVPFTLLIPLVGVLSSVIFLGEPFQLWKLVAGLLVITGLCINLIGARFFPMKMQEA